MKKDDARKLSYLKGELQRIKTQSFSKKYLEKRTIAINDAEKNRTNGKMTSYLMNSRTPYTDNLGQAYVHYDHNQKTVIEEQIEELRSNNATTIMREIGISQPQNNSDGSSEQGTQ